MQKDSALKARSREAAGRRGWGGSETRGLGPTSHPVSVRAYGRASRVSSGPHGSADSRAVLLVLGEADVPRPSLGR